MPPTRSTPARAGSVCAILAATTLMTAGLATSQPEQDATRVLARGRGRPWISYDDGRSIGVSSRALDRSPRRLRARPAALASGQLDGDGIADLVVAYAGAGGGALVVYPGNPASIFPELRRSGAREDLPADGPFLQPSCELELPDSPDLAVTGDFDADGFTDVLTGAKGGRRLQWLRGDGHGGLHPPRPLALPGALTDLAAGEIHEADGLADIAVSVTDGMGARLLLFASPAGALADRPEEAALPPGAGRLAIGSFDGDSLGDVAVSAGRRLLLLSGRPRAERSAADRRSGAPSGLEEAAVFSEGIVALAAGRFAGRGGPSDDLAIMTRDGGLHFLALPGADRPAGGPRLESAGSPLAVPAAVSAGIPMRAARTSGAAGEHVLALDRAGGRILLLASERGRTDAAPRVATFEVAGTPVDVLPMRLNEDALGDLVVLTEEDDLPATVMSSPLTTFNVNVTTDSNDLFPGNNSCADAAGKCSFRAAIQESNSHVGADTIQFALGAGTPTLSFTLGLLPDITDTVTINGATGGATRVQLNGAGIGGRGLDLEPGFSTTGNATTLRGLVINRFGGSGIIVATSDNRVENCYSGTDASGGGTVAGNGGEGVLVTFGGVLIAERNIIGGSSTAQRNVISRNSGHGVLIESESANNTVAGNLIGTDAAGTGALPNGLDGVRVVTDATRSTIGGPAATPGVPPGNVISGNSGYGIELDGLHAGVASIQGNLIGTRADGLAGLGNALGGVLVRSGASGAVLGGTSPSLRNVISGNAGVGVTITDAISVTQPSSARVTGNWIGADINGAAAIPNGGAGVLVTAGATGTIGGTLSLTPGACTGECNLIALNGGSGVRVDSASSRQVGIQGNATHSQSGLGIDLGSPGVTPNDAGDADSGANDLQNFPVLTSSGFDGTTTTVRGSLNSTASTSFTVDLYDSPAADGTGYGEGAAWLGSVPVTTNASGSGSFLFTTATNVRFVTTTATGPGGTSEFSAAFFNPGEASPAGTMTAARGSGSSVLLAWTPACAATDHAAFQGIAGPGALPGGPVWTAAFCSLGVSGSASFDPGDPPPGRMFYFIVAGQTTASEGSYGRSTSGGERPEAVGIGACDRGQSLTVICP